MKTVTTPGGTVGSATHSLSNSHHTENDTVCVVVRGNFRRYCVVMQEMFTQWGMTYRQLH